ncbi:hypothetical protein EDB87DRAFT_1691880 [Lactarius vividus]|nr:hypothetical protein EDB87DRAFT_1691880 [Lactarius vividus]
MSVCVEPCVMFGPPTTSQRSSTPPPPPPPEDAPPEPFITWKPASPKQELDANTMAAEEAEARECF